MCVCVLQDVLEGSQGQYIKLEREIRSEYDQLEKKYHKAKKLIKEYQQRSVSTTECTVGASVHS